MSNSLYYEIVQPSHEKDLPDELKRILTERYELQNGKYRLNSTSLDYLQGLLDANIPGVNKLIDAIEKYDAVDIFLEG